MKKHYQNIVVGGGIVGAGILRDLALHKKETLLIDKGDFSSQTSQGSSKMLHGGIRYLENFDFGLVFEALKEKKVWLKLAPHISYEKKFFLPVYKESKWPLFFLRIGLFVYDLLSLFKNPPYKIINKHKTLVGIQGLRSEGLKGAGVYSDGVVDDSKLALDLIIDSVALGVEAKNYHEIIKVEHSSPKVVTVKNTLTNELTEYTCDHLIIAAGPFTDKVLNQLEIPWQDIILPSKGSHIWLKKDSLSLKDAMVLQTKDNRIIFVIPQRNAILVGTTEIALDNKTDIFDIKASEEEINYLVDNLNYYFPKENISNEDILSSFCAVRPLVRSGKSSSKTSRTHKVFNPKEGVYVIAGGKYTTFRVMAQDLCKKLFKDNNQRYDKNLSLKPLNKKSIIYDVHHQEITKELLQKLKDTEFVKTKEDLILRRLSLYSLSQYSESEKLESLINEIF